jgi:small conductance mechanosensitive channel
MKPFFEGILNRLNEIFHPETLGLQVAQWIANVFIGLVVFSIFFLLWKLLKMILKHSSLKRFDETAVSFVQNIAKYSLLSIGLVYALNAMGIKTTAVLASLGIMGLTIGFAARDALSNIISGILIFIDRPFVIGDLVDIEGSYGRVDKITLRSTRIVTVDGRMLAVPNTEVINKTVASYTNFPNLRVDVAVSVAVTEDLERARTILLELVTDDPDYMNNPSPRVVVTQLNDYNVMLELQAWLKDERKHVEKRYILREKVFNTFNNTGIVMPFETIQLTPFDIRIGNQIEAKVIQM